MMCETCKLPAVRVQKRGGKMFLHGRGSPHDPCIAMLPGVRYACCGHGVPGGNLAGVTGGTSDHCYVYFEPEDGLAITLRGNAARAAMEMLGGSPPPPHPDAHPPLWPRIEVWEPYG